MRRRLATTDWSQTALGAIETWPQSLRVAVGICMNSRFPMFVWWGDALVNLYNDAYIPVLGQRHPAAFGRPARDFWGDIWPVVGPQAEAVMQRGEATWNERVLLEMERNGYTEQTYFTWSYSPIPDGAGGIGGLFCACTEETPRVLAERQRDTLLQEIEAERSRLAAVFGQSPAFLVALRGAQHVFEFVNERYYQLIGRRDVIGKPLLQAVPELEAQGFLEVLDHVYASGEPFVGQGRRLMLRREEAAALDEVFVDFAYVPTRDAAGRVTGVLVHGVDVTERERAQRTLIESEANFRQLADAMPQIVFSTRPDGQADYFNRQWYDYTGLPPGSLDFEHWHQVHTEAGLARAVAVWQEALREGRPYEIEYPLRRHDGVYRWHLGRSLPVRDEQGRIVRWLGTNTDIDDRKRIEQSLRESEARFRNMSDHAPVMVWVTDADGRCQYINKAWCDFTGQSEAQALGLGWLDVVHPQDMPRTKAAFLSANAAQALFSVEYRLRRRDGEYRWCVDSAAPRLGGDGAFLGYIGSVVDITERKHIEQALTLENSVLELIATGAPVPLVLDTLLRRTEEQSQDGMLGAVLLPDDRGGHLVHGAAPSLPAAFVRRVDDLRIGWPTGGATGSDAAADALQSPRLRRLAAEHGLRTCSALAVVGSEGRPLGALAVFYRQAGVSSAHDAGLLRAASHLAGIVIEKSQAELRLRHSLAAEQHARAEVERAGRAKDEFLATLSHELRTPLNAILGWTLLLGRKHALAPDIARGVEVIERNARAQSKIIEDLLEMSAIIAGKIRLDQQPLDLTEAVQLAVETARPAAEAKGLRLDLGPAPPDGVTVCADAGRLQQVLSNLLSNAVKFTPPQGRIDVALAPADGGWRVSVRDSGEGIAAEFLPFVFDRFRQADASATRRHGGLGLGLAIVKQLAELHGGAVAVDSAGAGQGACFTVTFPAQREAPAPQATAQRHRPSHAPTADTAQMEGEIAGLSVLVVDDQSDARDLLRRLLEQGRARVSTAGSAEEALALLRERRFDVLVSDIGMPGEDGHALLRRLRALAPQAGGATPAIALTAYARPEDRLAALRAGFQVHLAKPVEPAELVASVRSLAGPGLPKADAPPQPAAGA